jgi:hypothetical protein
VFASLEKRALQEAIVDVAECPVGDRLKDADGHEGEGADECGDCGSGCGEPIGASNLRLPANSKPDSADYTPDRCGNGGKLVAGRDDQIDANCQLNAWGRACADQSHSPLSDATIAESN